MATKVVAEYQEDTAMDGSPGLRLSAREISAAFADPEVAKQFPPILTIDQAADLLQIPKATLYDWRSRGLLNGCSRRIGKHIRFFRDRLINRLFNQ